MPLPNGWMGYNRSISGTRMGIGSRSMMRGIRTPLTIRLRTSLRTTTELTYLCSPKKLQDYEVLYVDYTLPPVPGNSAGCAGCGGQYLQRFLAGLSALFYRSYFDRWAFLYRSAATDPGTYGNRRSGRR